MRAFLRLLPAMLLVLPPLPILGAAQAQGLPGPEDVARPQTQAPARAAPAPALPGLAARRAVQPIPADPTAVLSPNDALFDAINRGDLAAARDAVGRGARLEARNALGLTPLDAAVDQGRNDIAFFLLSARDMSRRPAPPVPADNLAGPPALQPAPSPAPRAVAVPPAAAPAPVAVAPRRAPLWAGDGGAPRPEIGFLGFDAGRPPGAEPPGAPRRAGRS